MGSKFTRIIENFICDKCGEKVLGDGYTNHCPKCLTSKHVDIFPGDRKSSCRGLMEAVGVEKKGDKYFISHKCLKCGHVGKNKMQTDDNFEEILKLIKLTSK